MEDLISMDMLKRRIKYLYEKHPTIHINIKITSPKLHLENVPARIVGVYPNIFIISENSKGYEERHTLMYTDVWIGQIEILELTKFK